jgi:hypothetical protein
VDQEYHSCAAKQLHTFSGQSFRSQKASFYKGAPHGLRTTHKNQINEDLFPFHKA